MEKYSFEKAWEESEKMKDIIGKKEDGGNPTVEEYNVAQELVEEEKNNGISRKKEDNGSKRNEADLSEHDKKRFGEHVRIGEFEEAVKLLHENGVPLSTRARMLSHESRGLEESIRVISWTKKRLRYTTAILEHTLASEDKKVTSIDNLIRNYLIFNRIFKDKEEKLPRYGQFAYVMKEIFGGITSREEIYERIKKHKTFGEKVEEDEEIDDGIDDEIKNAANEINNNFSEALKKKRKLDEAMEGAKSDEEQEKGKVWSASYSPPKQYTFPHYTFQTGINKGLNTAMGRSSWEPMFMAYVDVINKGIEDKVNRRDDIDETEKKERIRRNQIQLYYEPFDFPVDVKIDANGEERPVVYRLDFIDFNRWKAIEVKGPLTPEAADKIRWFKKYYVDGDFSGLPEEKQIIMIKYVEIMKEKIARFCQEQGLPVFDHFSSLSVLGVYKWDHEINNFNKYSGAKDMSGISERQRELLQKGFIKQLEERIKAGKTPDIRPEEYVESDKLAEVVRINKKEARKNGLSYIVEQVAVTKPFSLDLIHEIIQREFFAHGDIEQGADLVQYEIMKYVLDTLPISKEKKDFVIALESSLDTFDNVEKIIKFHINKFSKNEIDKLDEGSIRFRADLGRITKEEYEKMIEGFKMFRKYLLNIDEKKIKTIIEQFKPINVTKIIKLIYETFESCYLKEDNQINIDRDFIEQSQKLGASAKSIKLAPLVLYYISLELGEYGILQDERNIIAMSEIHEFILKKSQTVPHLKERIEENIEKIKKFGIPDTKMFVTLLQLIASKVFIEENVTKSYESMFLIANNISREYSLTPGNIGDFVFDLEKKYKNLKIAAEYFASRNNYGFNMNDYSEAFNRISESDTKITDLVDDQEELRDFLSSNGKIISSAAEIFLGDELGYEKLKSMNIKYDRYIKNTLNNTSTDSSWSVILPGSKLEV